MLAHDDEIHGYRPYSIVQLSRCAGLGIAVSARWLLLHVTCCRENRIPHCRPVYCTALYADSAVLPLPPLTNSRLCWLNLGVVRTPDQVLDMLTNAHVMRCNNEIHRLGLRRRRNGQPFPPANISVFRTSPHCEALQPNPDPAVPLLARWIDCSRAGNPHHAQRQHCCERSEKRADCCDCAS